MGAIGGGRALSRRALVTRGGVLVGAGAALAACAAPGGGGAAGPGKQPVTIWWSTWGDAKHVFNTTAVPKGLELFKQKYPYITVRPEEQVGSTEWVAKNTSEWIAGDGPDLSGHCCADGLNFARQGFMQNLDAVLKRDAKAVPTGDYVEWLFKFFSSPQNGQWGLPMYTGTMAILYNRSAFKNKGLPYPDDTWDWNKYRDVALKLTDPSKEQWGREILLSSHIHRRFYQNGATMVDPKDDTKAAFQSEKAVQAMQLERDMALRDKSTVVTSGPTMPDAIKGMTQAQRMVSGKIAMFEGASFGIPGYLTNLADVDWDFAPLPKGPVGRFTLATNDGWGVWSGSKKQDATWELLKFLQSDEWTDIATRIAGQQSARKTHQQRWMKAMKEANPKLADKNLAPFVDAVEKGYARPNMYFRKDAESSKEFVAAWDKSVRDGAEEIAATMRAAAALVDQLNKG